MNYFIDETRTLLPTMGSLGYKRCDAPFIVTELGVFEVDDDEFEEIENDAWEIMECKDNDEFCDTVICFEHDTHKMIAVLSYTIHGKPDGSEKHRVSVVRDDGNTEVYNFDDPHAPDLLAMRKWNEVIQSFGKFATALRNPE